MPTDEVYQNLVKKHEVINKQFTALNDATEWIPIGGWFVFAALYKGAMTLALEVCYGDPSVDPIYTRTSITASGYNVLFEPTIGTCVPVYRVRCTAFTSDNAYVCFGPGREKY